MRTFAQRPKATQQTMTAKSTKAGRALSAQSRDVHSILRLQRTIGNHAMQRLLQTDAEEGENSLHSGSSSHFAQDFSQISVRPASGFSFADVRVHPRREAVDAMSVRPFEATGSVLDQDASAALDGPDVDPEVASEPPLQAAPEVPQGGDPEAGLGGEKEAEPLQEGGERPVATGTPAEGAKAKEGEGEGCAKASDHAGILALMTKAKAPKKPKKTLAYGFTFWAASGITYPKVEFDWTKSGKKWTGTVKKTIAGMGKVEALYLKPGTYKIPEQITARGPACGKSGKKADFYSKLDKDISALAEKAEQEHCDDYKRAFDLSYGKWAGLINSIAGTTFGPGTREQVMAQAAKELKAKGDKGRKGWIEEAIRLKKLSLKRDLGDHSMKPDGAPVVVNATCTRVDGTSVKGPKTNIPGPSSKTLIK